MFGLKRFFARKAEAPFEPIVFTPEHKAADLLACLAMTGERMKAGAFDAFVEAYKSHTGSTPALRAQLGAIAEAYAMPKGIEMPWGLRVKP